MFKDLLKKENFPTSWCPGCGIGMIMTQTAIVMDELGLNHTNSTIVSGVGCTGRMPGYFRVDGVYTLHGRALPVAEAIKVVNPELNVIVISGDGDLSSIGGNHLLHVARRNANVTVLCNANQVYALTGGQTGPLTPRGARTISSPQGAAYDPVDIQNLMKSAGSYFYARTTVFHQKHFQNCIKSAIEWPGFAFIEVRCHCIENNGRRQGFASAYEMLQDFRKSYKRAAEGAESLAPNEIGIVHS